MRIAVVDNDRALVRSLTLVLSNQGHEVAGFVDAETAAAQLGRTLHPDVLILDCVMPRLNGGDLLERVHARLPVHCRVFLISGHSDCLHEQRLDSFRLSARLPKPLDLNALSRLVRGDHEEVGDERT